MLDHRPGDSHPERPERLRAVIDALQDASDLELILGDAPLAEAPDLRLVHPKAYVEEILKLAPGAGVLQLDRDTYVSAGSVQAARRAAGAVDDRRRLPAVSAPQGAAGQLRQPALRR
jgi:acetoin utilization deacetylase AcuC-like enzyme